MSHARPWWDMVMILKGNFTLTCTITIAWKCHVHYCAEGCSGSLTDVYLQPQYSCQSFWGQFQLLHLRLKDPPQKWTLLSISSGSLVRSSRLSQSLKGSQDKYSTLLFHLDSIMNPPSCSQLESCPQSPLLNRFQEEQHVIVDVCMVIMALHYELWQQRSNKET